MDLNLKSLSLAAGELRFLLERGYPRGRSLRLVGDRHALTASEREVLRRGVVSPQATARRRAKLRGIEDLAGQPVGLDGHNVLITLESALAGRILVRADDGAIRDIAQAASSFRLTEATGQAVEIVLGVLVERGAAEAHFFLDEPVSHSGRLAALIRDKMAEQGLAGTASAVPVPERQLKAFEGLVASSDGELIETCARPLDLAGLILEKAWPKGQKGTMIDLAE